MEKSFIIKVTCDADVNTDELKQQLGTAILDTTSDNINQLEIISDYTISYNALDAIVLDNKTRKKVPLMNLYGETDNMRSDK